MGLLTHNPLTTELSVFLLLLFSQLSRDWAICPPSRRSSLHTPHHHTSLNISAFLFGSPPTHYAETRHAYQDAIVYHSPDDFFSLKKALDPHCDRLTLQQAIAYIRLSGWDAKIFSAERETGFLKVP